jgi:hypothetical protein
MAKKRKNNTGHHAGKKSKHHHHHHHGLYGVDQAAPVDKRLVQTAVETGKDLLIGVVGGGLAGAMIGKPSLLVGILVTGAGHFTNNRLAQLIGVGMMASNGFQSGSTATNGLDGLDGVKDRLMAYKDSFSQKFYLDKFMKKKAAELPATTAGIGEVQYFTYPDALNGDLAALSEIENQLAESALEFQGTAGDLPEMSGDLPDTQVGDIEDDRLY